MHTQETLQFPHPEIPFYKRLEVEIGVPLGLTAVMALVLLSRRRAKKTVPSAIVLPDPDRKEDTPKLEENPLDREIAEVEASLSAKGFGVSPSFRKFLTLYSNATNDGDIFRLFGLYQKKANKRVVTVHVGKNFSYDETLADIYTQITGESPATSELPKLYYLIGDLKPKFPFALAVTIDPELANEKKVGNLGRIGHNNEDIDKFDGLARSWIQHDPISACFLSTNPSAVPSEMARTCGQFYSVGGPTG